MIFAKLADISKAVSKRISIEFDRFQRSDSGATSSIMAMVMVMSLPIVAGSADALRWSVGYVRMANATTSSCDRMILTSRNHPHTFQNDARVTMALSNFDLQISYVYPEALRSANLGVVGLGENIPLARFSSSVDIDTIVLNIFGIDELPVTVSVACQGYPPFPILGDYIVNNEFHYFDPATFEFDGTWGTTDQNGIHEVHFVSNINQFGWYATREGARCGIEFGTTWRLHDQGNNPPPSGNTWAIQPRGCGLNWALRQLELHPGYYELYFESQSAGGLGSSNRTTIEVAEITEANNNWERPYQGGWSVIDSFGGGIKIWGLKAGWWTERALWKVDEYKVYMMGILPQWNWLTIVHNQGANFAHFKIRYLGTEADESDAGYDYVFDFATMQKL